jgi:hypothetical protein
MTESNADRVTASLSSNAVEGSKYMLRKRNPVEACISYRALDKTWSPSFACPQCVQIVSKNRKMIQAFEREVYHSQWTLLRRVMKQFG